MAKVLIVEGNKCRAEALRTCLSREQHIVEIADNGATGLEQLYFNHFDLCILNWDASLLSGVELVTQYRSAGGNSRILMLTQSASEQDIVQALDAGADDCVAQPYRITEVAARVRAVLRRPNLIVTKIYHFNDFVFNTEAKYLTRAGVEIKLQGKEYQLLEFLLRYPNRFFKAEALLRRLWESSRQVSEETVRTIIKTLRRKIDNPGSPSIIFTLPGLGYRLNLSCQVDSTSSLQAVS